MTEISPLRRRMVEDMTVRNLSPATQRSYVHAVAGFGRLLGRSPDTSRPAANCRGLYRGRSCVLLVVKSGGHLS